MGCANICRLGRPCDQEMGSGLCVHNLSVEDLAAVAGYVEALKNRTIKAQDRSRSLRLRAKSMSLSKCRASNITNTTAKPSLKSTRPNSEGHSKNHWVSSCAGNTMSPIAGAAARNGWCMIRVEIMVILAVATKTVVEFGGRIGIKYTGEEASVTTAPRGERREGYCGTLWRVYSAHRDSIASCI